MKYQLTSHLQVQPDKLVGSFGTHTNSDTLLLNAVHQTRTLIKAEEWDLLASYETPREPGDSPFEQRLAAAKIIGPVDGKSSAKIHESNFIKVAQRILEKRRVTPLESLPELVVQLKENCQPLNSFEPPVDYIWRDPKHLFQTLLDHYVAYVQIETGGTEAGAISTRFAQQSVGRPERKNEFAQQLCTIHTSTIRTQRIQERFPAPARFLTLGDDDLMSLALTEKPGYEISVFEIDTRLVRFIRKRCNERVKIFSRDLSSGLPKSHHASYDAVLADPPYNVEGMNFFLGCAVAGLKKTPESRLYVSTCPSLLEDAEKFIQSLTTHGLTLECTLENFNRYPMPEETRKMCRSGLEYLGYPRELVQTILEVPYLYADLFECRLTQP